MSKVLGLLGATLLFHRPRFRRGFAAEGAAYGAMREPFAPQRYSISGLFRAVRCDGLILAAISPRYGCVRFRDCGHQATDKSGI